MKKIFTAIVAMMLAVPAMAQFASGGFELDKNNVYYGARMGLNLASMSGDVEQNSMKAGLNLGGVIGLRVSSSSPVFLESGLYYTQRGGKDGDNKMTIKYLEVPLVVKYGIKATDDIALLPFAGPYFSYGIGGRVKGGKNEDGTKIDFSSFNLVNHGDMGLKIGCGAEYDMLYMEVGYQFGIANIADDDVVDGTVHGNALFINFGVNF
jgi:hypothetical protein